MSFWRDQVVALALALERGDVSREQAIEGFVLLVLRGRAAPDCARSLAVTIARDEILSARFDRLFERLT